MNNEIINSKNPEFDEILEKALFGFENIEGLESLKNRYESRLGEYKESFNKISKTLKSKIRKI